MGGWSAARRILAVRLDALGGVLMTTPALHALQSAGPVGRAITLLTSSAGAEAAPLLADVDDVVAYDPPWMRAGAAAPTPDLDMIERLREQEFDAAAVFTPYTQSALPAALICHLAGIPLRVAYSREDPRSLLTDWVREPEPELQMRHEVRRQLDLVAAVGVPAPDAPLRLSLPDGAADGARGLLVRAGVDPGEPWIVAHPGASAPSRRYPAWSYAEVLRRLVVEDRVQVVITGGPDELELAQDLAAGAGSGCVVLAGRTTLEQFAGVVSQSALLLSNNTGPVHLAAALGVPVVDLYALTTPQYRPWLVPSRVLSHDVPCRWCHEDVCPLGHHLCLRGVQPDEVVGAVRELLREPRL